ncbi:Bicd Family-Like Cargo Adapter 2 [Manis pentadactyla]|nr:Bicd Family-Like Cargo Adapter 2 [Manis pentadactyla]
MAVWLELVLVLPMGYVLPFKLAGEPLTHPDALQSDEVAHDLEDGDSPHVTETPGPSPPVAASHRSPHGPEGAQPDPERRGHQPLGGRFVFLPLLLFSVAARTPSAVDQGPGYEELLINSDKKKDESVERALKRANHILDYILSHVPKPSKILSSI